MLGSFPCYPGVGDHEEYKGRHFYCTLCSEVVSPCFVDVVVVDAHGVSTEILKVLRCKQHRIRGLGLYGPITSLWALEGKDSRATELREKMFEVCSRVRNFDICAILSIFSSAMCFLGSVILGFLIAGPLTLAVAHWVIPVVVTGVGLALGILGVMCTYFSKSHIRTWQKYSREYVEHSLLRQVQLGTEKYAVLTSFPPTCSLSPTFQAPFGNKAGLAESPQEPSFS